MAACAAVLDTLAHQVIEISQYGYPQYLSIQEFRYQYAQQRYVTVGYFRLTLALFASLRPKYKSRYVFTSASLKHTLPSGVILRRTTFIQPILSPSGPH